MLNEAKIWINGLRRKDQAAPGLSKITESAPVDPATAPAAAPAARGIPDLGDAMLRPGPKAKPMVAVESVLPPPVPAPEPSVVEPEPVVALAIASPEPVAQPDNPDTKPSIGIAERRTDLPPRTPGRIRFLLQFENGEQTASRILNDGQRFRYPQQVRAKLGEQRNAVVAELQAIIARQGA